MTRILALGAVLSALSCGGSPAPASDPGAAPNLVLIVMDTCRGDRVGGEDVTPELAAFAEEAVVFEDCQSQSTATGPSHRSIFTGQFVHRHGQTANRDSRETPYDVARLLRAGGYRTAAFVGGGAVGKNFHFDEGFEIYRDLFDHTAIQRREPGNGHLAKAVDEATEWLDTVEDERFFLFVHGYDPHCPYWPREDLRQRASWYEGFLDPRGRCASMGYEKMLAAGALGPDEWRYINDLYDGGIEEGDEAIGRLIDDLRERGLLDDTLVVFTSDHGESLGERGVLGHGEMWEEQMHVPLMVRLPGGEHAGRNTDMVQHVDIAPTLLSAAGVEAPPGVQGVDLMPRMRGTAPPLGDRMRVTQVRDQVAVRFDKRWKIAFVAAEDGGVSAQALFDLRDDPGETTNLFETEDGRERFDELLARYQAFRAETKIEDRYWLRGASLDALDDKDRQALEALGYTGDSVK